MCGGNKIELIMKLFTELIFIKRIGEGLIEFFFVQFISFNKEVFDFVIIIFFPSFEFENSKYFDFSDGIESINCIFTYFIKRNVPERL